MVTPPRHTLIPSQLQNSHPPQPSPGYMLERAVFSSTCRAVKGRHKVLNIKYIFLLYTFQIFETSPNVWIWTQNIWRYIYIKKKLLLFPLPAQRSLQNLNSCRHSVLICCALQQGVPAKKHSRSSKHERLVGVLERMNLKLNRAIRAAGNRPLHASSWNINSVLAMAFRSQWGWICVATIGVAMLSEVCASPRQNLQDVLCEAG